MRKLSCRDAGIVDCNCEVTADTDEAVLRRASEHGRSAHDYQVTQEDERKMRGLIRNMTAVNAWADSVMWGRPGERSSPRLEEPEGLRKSHSGGR